MKDKVTNAIALLSGFIIGSLYSVIIFLLM